MPQPVKLTFVLKVKTNHQKRIQLVGAVAKKHHYQLVQWRVGAVAREVKGSIRGSVNSDTVANGSPPMRSYLGTVLLMR